MKNLVYKDENGFTHIHFFLPVILFGIWLPIAFFSLLRAIEEKPFLVSLGITSILLISFMLFNRHDAKEKLDKEIILNKPGIFLSILIWVSLYSLYFSPELWGWIFK